MDQSMERDAADTERGIEDWQSEWGQVIERLAREAMIAADAAHGIEHVQRVVGNAIQLSYGTLANPCVVLPAAWLHDSVSVPKNSPDRSRASTLAASHARELLWRVAYPECWIEPIAHCIAAHSFSAGIACQTLEAELVQDADRLEALGAIGIARCLMTGGSMGQRLYHPNDPFPLERPPSDCEQSIDHFFAKLLGLHRTMRTEPGRVEAVRRTRFLVQFLEQLASEIGADPERLRAAIAASS
jgi:uncharacterized protein